MNTNYPKPWFFAMLIFIRNSMTLYFKVLLILSINSFYFGIFADENPYPGTTTVFISYENAETNTDLTKSPTINIGFDGSGHYVPFIMDTGSVGIIASSDIFKPAPGAKNLGKGRQIYSSSGIIEEGTWWTATQEIYDADGKLVATASVPVLQVTSIKCTDDARSCTPSKHPKKISVMGVGFGRESPEQHRKTPKYNAFLNLRRVLRDGSLKRLPKDWCNGYVVCPNGVYLGLTSDNTTNAAFVKLLPWTKYTTRKLSEWMPAPMTINTNGVSGDGHILMDTGVTSGFLTPPANANLGTLVKCSDTAHVECLPDGNVIGVYLPNESQPVAFYTFTVGESGNLMQPVGVHHVKGTKVFFNTSRHVLGGINFLYDNTNGYIGYIWNGQSPASVGFVHPATISSTTTLTSSKNPSRTSERVTFTATVAGVKHSQIPTGGVIFVVDGRQKYVALNNKGEATFSTARLSRGKHTITAKYSGDSIYIRSSSHLSQKIN